MIARALTCQSSELAGAWDNDLVCAYSSFDLIGRGPDPGTKDQASPVQDTKEWQAVVWTRNNRLASRSTGWSIPEDNGVASVDLSLETMDACRRTIGGLVEQQGRGLDEQEAELIAYCVKNNNLITTIMHRNK